MTATLHAAIQACIDACLLLAIVYLYANQRIIMATQAATAKALNDVADELVKATKEIVDAVAASGNTSPDIDNAVARLQGLAKALDDLNKDETDPVDPATPAAKQVGKKSS